VNLLYKVILGIVWGYDLVFHWFGFHSFYCRCRDVTKCCICKGGVGVVAYQVPKSFGRTEQVAFCQGCIEGLRNAGYHD